MPNLPGLASILQSALLSLPWCLDRPPAQPLAGAEPGPQPIEKRREFAPAVAAMKLSLDPSCRVLRLASALSIAAALCLGSLATAASPAAAEEPDAAPSETPKPRQRDGGVMIQLPQSPALKALKI